MREQAWTEWLASPETRALLAYLRRRRDPVVALLFSGAEVPPVTQGRAVAYHELEGILTKAADEVDKILGGAK